MSHKLDKSAHSIYSLNIHPICCVEKRRQIFDNEELIYRLKEINISLAEKKGYRNTSIHDYSNFYF
ncbi:MAG: hypothetical protein R6U96_12360 [Promethearchaeia archaeon]